MQGLGRPRAPKQDGHRGRGLPAHRHMSLARERAAQATRASIRFLGGQWHILLQPVCSSQIAEPFDRRRPCAQATSHCDPRKTDLPCPSCFFAQTLTEPELLACAYRRRCRFRVVASPLCASRPGYRLLWTVWLLQRRRKVSPRILWKGATRFSDGHPNAFEPCRAPLV